MAYSSYTVFDGDMYPYYDVSFFTGLFTVFFTIFLFYPEMGICDIPKVNKGFGIVLFIINIFLPGIGTIVGGIANEGGCDCGEVVAGILQTVLTTCAIGWFWSIYTGAKMGICRD